jgi:hypothetical protein
MARVGLSHASDATTTAIWSTVRPSLMETAMMMRTRRPGTVRPTSTTPRMTASILPR